MRDLETLGVEIHLGVRVTGVDADGVDTVARDPELRRVSAITKIWAAGVEASPLGRVIAEATGTAVDRAGRVAGARRLPVARSPRDLRRRRPHDLPGSARAWPRSRCSPARTPPGRSSVGWTTSRASRSATAIWDRRRRSRVSGGYSRSGRSALYGLIGWLGWLVVHLTFLTGFKNRLATLASWTVAFVGRGRPQRAITARQALGSEVTSADRPPDG